MGCLCLQGVCGCIALAVVGVRILRDTGGMGFVLDNKHDTPAVLFSTDVRPESQCYTVMYIKCQIFVKYPFQRLLFLIC